MSFEHWRFGHLVFVHFLEEERTRYPAVHRYWLTLMHDQRDNVIMVFALN